MAMSRKMNGGRW